MKVINKVIKICEDCPYFMECEGSISCENMGKYFERKDFKIIEKGFPDWCPLEDYKKDDRIK